MRTNGKMEKFQTHAGPKTVDDIMSEVLKRKGGTRVFAAEAVIPGEFPSETIRVGPSDYEVKDAESVSAWKREIDGFFGDDRLYASTYSTATGPVGPSGSGPYGAPPGANGPAGPLNTHVPTAPTSSGVLPERDRAEVDLRKAIRRCHKDGVPLERMVEIFRLELVDIVHDD